jgi:hypothetical protein
MRWASHAAHTGEKRGAYKVLVGKREGKTPLGGVVILKWIFGKWDGSLEWIDLAQDRDKWRALKKAVMNLRAL